ncbi:hypothetical protein CCHR01_11771 [Colletotrichum chrysophilum]|uniref:Uncharacterized protein n=1 Tax=Colletotrichum chrysophilum TaxID=1836956 RepID=A0AAD9ACI2_9PEZI|nr:hypothetical protein CCHR01_11771 [Colletotrichum chrysophilum]
MAFLVCSNIFGLFKDRSYPTTDTDRRVVLTCSGAQQ